MGISFTDLDRLAGEVLPERTVMSTVGSASSAAQTGGDSAGHGATAINGQQGTVSQGTPGLLGSLGLGSNNPGSTLSSSPGAIASN